MAKKKMKKQQKKEKERKKTVYHPLKCQMDTPDGSKEAVMAEKCTL